MSRKIVTPKFRVSFCNIFQPKAFGEGKPKYSIMMLFPKSESLAEIRALMKDTVNEKWPNETARPKKLANPIKDGDTDVMDDGSLRCEKYPELKGHWFISASSLQRVGLVDQDCQPILDQNEFYSGCYAKASITCFAFAPSKDRPMSKYGVGFGLQNVMKLADGEPFSGRSSAADDFGVAKTGTPKGSADGDMFS